MFGSTKRACGLLFIAAMTAASGAGQASAIDRLPASALSTGDASRGYGASSSGYGAERQYYGSERFGSGRRAGSSGRFGGAVDAGDYGGSIIRFERGFEADERYGEAVHGFEGNDEAADGDALYEGYGSRSGVVSSFDASEGSGVLYLDDAANGGSSVTYVEPRSNVIDVEEARLDKLSPSSSGSVVSFVGATKIIRIAASNAPVDTGAPGAGLTPWSESWARYCSRAHASFDPRRGTFTSEDGSVRFCTGQ